MEWIYHDFPKLFSTRPRPLRQEDEDVEDAEILAPSEGAIDAPAVSSAEDLFGAAFFEAKK